MTLFGELFLVICLLKLFFPSSLVLWRQLCPNCVTHANHRLKLMCNSLHDRLLTLYSHFNSSQSNRMVTQFRNLCLEISLNNQTLPTFFHTKSANNQTKVKLLMREIILILSIDRYKALQIGMRKVKTIKCREK